MREELGQANSVSHTDDLRNSIRQLQSQNSQISDQLRSLQDQFTSPLSTATFGVASSRNEITGTPLPQTPHEHPLQHLLGEPASQVNDGVEDYNDGANPPGAWVSTTPPPSLSSPPSETRVLTTLFTPSPGFRAQSQSLGPVGTPEPGGDDYLPDHMNEDHEAVAGDGNELVNKKEGLDAGVPGRADSLDWEKEA